MASDAGIMTIDEKGWTVEQRAFAESLGSDGIHRLGEIVFDFIKVVESGNAASIRAYRKQKCCVASDLGSDAQAYLDARLDDVEEQYLPQKGRTR